MTPTSDKMFEIIKEGNKYLLYFLFIFLFIHFAIVIPFKHSPDNSAIGEASKSIDKQLSFLNNSITTLQSVKDTITLKIKDTLTLSTKDILILTDSVKTIDEKIYNFQEKKIIYQKELIDLSQQKSERSFTIPILDISINESLILSIYPGYILVGLCLALIYRRRVLQLLIQLTDEERKDISLTIWVAPIPFSLKNRKFSSWAYLNTVGIGSHFLIIYVGIDFLLFRGNKFDFEILAVNTFIAMIAIVVYLIAIIQLISTEWKRIENRQNTEKTIFKLVSSFIWFICYFVLFQIYLFRFHQFNFITPKREFVIKEF